MRIALHQVASYDVRKLKENKVFSLRNWALATTRPVGKGDVGFQWQNVCLPLALNNLSSDSLSVMDIKKTSFFLRCFLRLKIRFACMIRFKIQHDT